MRKKIITSFILFFTITLTLPTLGQELYKVTSTELNIRIAPNKNSEVIGQLRNGEQVKVNSVENGWCKITMGDGRVGYVFEKYVTANTYSTNSSNTSGQPTVLGAIIMGIASIAFLYYVASSWLKSIFSTNSQDKSFTQEKPLKWYLCKSCAQPIRSKSQPQQRANCPGTSKTHTWTELAEVGDRNFMCKNCGINIWANKQPYQRANCPSQYGTHTWTEL
jgi:uncharacterized protein YlaI